MRQWYYVDGSERQGPVNEEELQSLVGSGAVTSESLVWHKGMAQWQRYGEVAAPQGADIDANIATDVMREGSPVNQGVSQVCAECGNVFSADEMVRYGESYVCATCKPVFFQRVKEGAPLRGVMVYGGFWIRFGAKFIDWTILSIINYSIQFAFGGAMTIESGQAPSGGFWAIWSVLMFAQMGAAAAYTTFFLGKFAATPGKMALGLKVITSDGGRVSYLRALGRHFAEWLSGIILLIGYIMAAFDEEKRTLHDRICDTRVIRK